jgi:hypothetical protein
MWTHGHQQLQGYNRPSLCGTPECRKDLAVPIRYEISLGLLELSTIRLLTLDEDAPQKDSWDRPENPLELGLL